MTALQSSGDTGTRVSTCVQDMATVVVFGSIEQGLDTGLGETPWSGVEGLFLCPDNGLGVGVRVKVFLELLPWEGVELLDTSDGRVGELVLLTVLDEGSVDLACAEYHTLDLFLGGDLEFRGLVGGVRDDPLEVRISGKVLNAGTCKRVS